jgi:hypothetical protein
MDDPALECSWRYCSVADSSDDIASRDVPNNSGRYCRINFPAICAAREPSLQRTGGEDGAARTAHLDDLSEVHDALRLCLLDGRRDACGAQQKAA